MPLKKQQEGHPRHYSYLAAGEMPGIVIGEGKMIRGIINIPFFSQTNDDLHWENDPQKELLVLKNKFSGGYRINT